MSMTTRALLVVAAIALATPAHARPIWQDIVQGGGRDGQANDVLANKDAVFVGGVVATATSNDLLLRSYEPLSGRLLWKDRYGMPGADYEIGRLATLGDRLFATVSVYRAADASGGDWVVRAYDATTGDLLWQDDVDRGPFDEARRIAAAGSRVVAVGTLTSASGHTAFAVRAYDSATGALVWQDQAGGLDTFGQATGVVATDDRVYVAGEVDRAPRVRAYDAASGATLWTSDSADAGFVQALVMAGGRIFVAVTVGGALTLRGYDAAEGALLWERQQPPRSQASDKNPIADVGLTATGGAVYAAVSHLLNDRTTLSAHVPGTGAVLWQNDDAVVARGLTLAGGRLYAAGGSRGFLVRAFDAASGAPVWETARDEDASALALDVVGDRVFVAGVAGPGFGTFYVAAFDWRPELIRKPIRRGGIRLPTQH